MLQIQHNLFLILMVVFKLLNLERQRLTDATRPKINNLYFIYKGTYAVRSIFSLILEDNSAKCTVIYSVHLHIYIVHVQVHKMRILKYEQLYFVVHCNIKYFQRH